MLNQSAGDQFLDVGSRCRWARLDNGIWGLGFGVTCQVAAASSFVLGPPRHNPGLESSLAKNFVHCSASILRLSSQLAGRFRFEFSRTWLLVPLALDSRLWHVVHCSRSPSSRQVGILPLSALPVELGTSDDFSHGPSSQHLRRLAMSRYVYFEPRMEFEL